MTDLERLKRAEEAEPMAVLVMDKMPEDCSTCHLNYMGLCMDTAESAGLSSRGEHCRLVKAIGIIEPNGHVVYLREEEK